MNDQEFYKWSDQPDRDNLLFIMSNPETLLFIATHLTLWYEGLTIEEKKKVGSLIEFCISRLERFASACSRGSGKKCPAVWEFRGTCRLNL
jgi:hypothetical protein